MKSKPSWIWGIYLSIYIFIVYTNTFRFFSLKSPMPLYYHIAIAFDTSFLFQYCLNALSIMLNALSIIPFFLFITQKQFLSLTFWRYLFIFRLAADIYGRPFEFKFFQSIFFQDRTVAILVLGTSIILIIPSYIALFIHAFGHPKFLKKKQGKKNPA